MQGCQRPVWDLLACVIWIQKRNPNTDTDLVQNSMHILLKTLILQKQKAKKLNSLYMKNAWKANNRKHKETGDYKAVRLAQGAGKWLMGRRLSDKDWEKCFK